MDSIPCPNLIYTGSSMLQSARDSQHDSPTFPFSKMLSILLKNPRTQTSGGGHRNPLRGAFFYIKNLYDQYLKWHIDIDEKEIWVSWTKILEWNLNIKYLEWNKMFSMSSWRILSLKKNYVLSLLYSTGHLCFIIQYGSFKLRSWSVMLDNISRNCWLKSLNKWSIKPLKEKTA